MNDATRPDTPTRLRVLVLGATGTAGRATTLALLRAGHEVVCLVRHAPLEALTDRHHLTGDPVTAELRLGNATDPLSLREDGFQGERFDALVSCLASRTGTSADAWAIDHQAHLDALAEANDLGVSHMVLLSAICVQRPRLEFQHAKLAFEKALIESGLTYSIVRPTAFFKSLAGQVERVRNGKSFLVFGDGTLTACKPISDEDLGDYMAGCLTDPERQNRILPIGGPGDALTPLEQGELLFTLAGQDPKFTRVPVGLIRGIGHGLALLGRLNRRLADKAELARIGHYYATESMLVFDEQSGAYDAAATPSTGKDTLTEFYAQLLEGTATVDRGAHAVFRD